MCPAFHAAPLYHFPASLDSPAMSSITPTHLPVSPFRRKTEDPPFPMVLPTVSLQNNQRGNHHSCHQPPIHLPSKHNHLHLFQTTRRLYTSITSPTLVSSNAEALHLHHLHLQPLHSFQAMLVFCICTIHLHLFRATQRFCTHHHHSSTCFEQRGASAPSTTSAWGFWNL